MTWITRWVRIALVMAVVMPPASAVPPPLPAFPPLQFNPPKPERWTLDNGIVVFLLEDHELPLIKIETMHRAGSQYDPADKVGLSQVFGPAMTLGGSLHHSPEDIEKTLDRTAASISFSVSAEAASGSMSCRAEDFNAIFNIFSDLLLRPQFDKRQVEIQKDKVQEALRRLTDDADDMARREFRALVYGRQHPYARLPTPDTVKSVKRQDLLDMHARYFAPNATWIAISGDFKAEAIKAKLRDTFGAWPKANVQLPSVAGVPSSLEKGVYYVQKPLNQSQIRVGVLGMARHDPDHFAWEVFNELWGGGATSILFRTVRTQQGLAYSVGSGYSEPAQTGIMVAVSQTRGAQTIAAVQSILKLMGEASAAPFSAEEVKWAKESIRNRFIENYSSSAQIASQVMSNEYYGFPADYLDTYPAKIGAVTADDLRRVGKKYLRTDQARVLIIGDLSTFDKPISTLGKATPVKPVDYSQEQP